MLRKARSMKVHLQIMEYAKNISLNSHFTYTSKSKTGSGQGLS